MFEQSIISKLLEGGGLEVLHANSVTPEMFLTCGSEIAFILKHYEQYKQVPDKITFLSEFHDFQMLEVSENMDYLVYKLKEAYTYTKLVPIIQNAADRVREDSIEAIDYLKDQLSQLERAVPVSGNKDGYDIITNAKDRLAEYKKRCEVKGLIGIPTGIPKLDELTNGWLWGEELVVITGRTNVGKSWMAEYFATIAYNLGYKILFYSGEMSKEIIGFRFDTLNKHFSNSGLLNGAGTLGKKPDTDGGNYLEADYENYINQLSQKSGFVVVTPDDFHGRKPNVDEIKELAIKHSADMIVVDQLSLMSDRRKADIPRIAYGNISEDLFLMSKELKKPVLLLAQANREAVKNRKKGESPELHDLAESDLVGQNSSRVLSLSVIDGTLKIALKKNRYGLNNKEVLMIWDINTGYLKPLLSDNPEEKTGAAKDKPEEGKKEGGKKDYGF
jgi:replicative DNA helicase